MIGGLLHQLQEEFVEETFFLHATLQQILRQGDQILFVTYRKIRSAIQLRCSSKSKLRNPDTSCCPRYRCYAYYSRCSTPVIRIQGGVQ